MKNITQKLSDSEYEKNFEELINPFSDNSAVIEATRCLYCFDSPCIKACPTHIDIPTFIKKISTGNIIGSAKTIYNSNWIALTCAKACPVDDLCEGACVFIEKGEKPIEIGRLQRYAVEYLLDKGTKNLFNTKLSNGKSVGIIGSGPAGLACGAELALLGYDVQIYESDEIPGGLNTWGIAPYKISRADSLKEIELIKNLGVSIQTSITVGKSISFDELINKHDSVFIGIGLGENANMIIPGDKLTGVFDAVDFIREVKKENWSSVDIGKRVAIIGAGNTAIDVATNAVRLGAEEVTVIYRRSIKEMPANDFEFELAKNDGIKFQFLSSPVELYGTSSVEGMRCVKMELGDVDKKGRRRSTPIPNSEFDVKVDMVVFALGQKFNSEFLQSIQDVKVVDGKIEVNPESFQTANQKVFAGGDCINGGKEVVNAAYDGKQAAHGINNYLSNLEI
ncbi:MAG: NAD(P)-dependent oxidoreductase [Melioribacteraceae bacterium]|jgi:dihydropyrimidine dehydrogenase (NAD+) subunit PreT|nr:NAD(P)-dependent oxidoreductase [Melioribacteraceae bacterium]